MKKFIYPILLGVVLVVFGIREVSRHQLEQDFATSQVSNQTWETNFKELSAIAVEMQVQLNRALAVNDKAVEAYENCIDNTRKLFLTR